MVQIGLHVISPISIGKPSTFRNNTKENIGYLINKRAYQLSCNNNGETANDDLSIPKVKHRKE